MIDDPREPTPAAPADPRFESLWTDYLEGVLDADGMAELDALLAADDRLVRLAADGYQTHRRLGLLAAERRGDSSAADAFVTDVMHRLPADGGALTRRVMDQLTAARGSDAKPVRRWSSRPLAGSLLVGGGLLAAVAVAVVALVTGPQSAAEPVRFASLARARFLGRETPARQSVVTRHETYVLSSGLVGIAFPRGATAIVEAPAVFRVCGADCLAVDSGRCSVHAPEGAEGFRVETPATRVIDRGTRFVVSVSETAETDVEVIEGAADLIVKEDEASAAGPVRLSAGEAARIGPTTGPGSVAAARAAESGAYQRQLPDRLVSYAATLRHPAAPPDPTVVDLDPGIDTLEDVTVQRGGRVVSYPAAELIGVELVHFRADKNRNNLVTPGTAEWTTERISDSRTMRGLLESDRLLTTGLINPGGSRSPPASGPRLVATANAEATPGLAVRFARPVVNDPGPDVVVFDLQMLSDPPQGDAFHVGPLEAAAGLRWHTVAAYDIDSTSPESRLLARFRLFQLPTPPLRLDDLLASAAVGGKVLPVRARCNAVGIDLSDLGYAAGASCDGLFFQDAADDDTTIDPTFIAGLPPLAGATSSAAEAAR